MLGFEISETASRQHGPSPFDPIRLRGLISHEMVRFRYP